MKTELSCEGSAKLRVPSASFSDPHHCEVFFNPDMEFNRTVSVAVMRAFAPKSVCDGMCALGARGMRYALEGGARKVVCVDANPAALVFANANIKLNKLKNVSAVEADINDFLDSHPLGFDFVEVDPFGSAVPFLESAAKAVKKGGMLSVTSTDLANLCAGKRVSAEKCRKDYAANPIRCDFSHELAARIFAGKVSSFGFKPVLVFYQGHYVKGFFVRGKKPKLGFVSYCPKCAARVTGKREKCACGFKTQVAGPLYLSDLCDKKFLAKVKGDARVAKLVGLLSGEIGFPPYFFDLHAVCDCYGLPGKAVATVLDKLRAKGFKAVRTHYCPNGIKTDADVKEVAAALR
ncbi:tRNA (guanine(26)-N(2))-dimethyltransferase [Candidatus Norongarragalina meridionalis]|nr:tRNA (guanine(26)-N(2))-dimethyltransferase [Candidatus Norongarragalina meridionalis]